MVAVGNDECPNRGASVFQGAVETRIDPASRPPTICRRVSKAAVGISGSVQATVVSGRRSLWAIPEISMADGSSGSVHRSG